MANACSEDGPKCRAFSYDATDQWGQFCKSSNPMHCEENDDDDDGSGSGCDWENFQFCIKSEYVRGKILFIFCSNIFDISPVNQFFL